MLVVVRRVVPPDVAPVYEQLPGIKPDDAEDDVRERGFSCRRSGTQWGAESGGKDRRRTRAVAADDREPLTRLESEAHVSKGGCVATGVCEGEIPAVVRQLTTMTTATLGSPCLNPDTSAGAPVPQESVLWGLELWLDFHCGTKRAQEKNTLERKAERFNKCPHREDKRLYGAPVQREGAQ